MKIASLEIQVVRTATYAFFILVLIPIVVIGLFTAIFNPGELGMTPGSMHFWSAYVSQLFTGLPSLFIK